MATASSVKVLRGRWPSLKHLASSTFKCKPCSSQLQSRCISIIGIKQNTQKFTKDHEWISTDNGMGKVGITAYAQDKLGDVVYVELPEVDLELSQGDNFGSLESVKAVSDLHAPVSGTVTEANEKLSDDPGLVNSSPYEDGWIIKVKLKDPQELDELMSKEDYEKYVREEEGQ